MIRGLYETHLPVRSLAVSIPFYERLGLTFARWQGEHTAFLWIEKGKSWLGLWEGEQVNTPYHASLRHIAFTTTYEDLRHAAVWLRSMQIEPVIFPGQATGDPVVRPNQGNASIYFDDPDGNSLELMANIDVPAALREITTLLTIEEWEEQLRTVQQS
ncbi:VOC family protein [Paenibacillus sp. GCM10027629]|uniref:VOC family protein n=1 Tax=Paenibacillus sp. GCM10027629 TaxID=3273414 RepID=UPI0036360A81